MNIVYLNTKQSANATTSEASVSELVNSTFASSKFEVETIESKENQKNQYDPLLKLMTAHPELEFSATENSTETTMTQKDLDLD